MKAGVLAVSCCLVALFALARNTAVADEPQVAAKKTYLVIYRPGPSWVQGKRVSQQPLAGHAPYLLGLYEKGSMKLAGPLMDDAGGAVVLEAADEAEAKAMVADDPAVKSGVFVAEMHPWHLVDWAKRALKAREDPS